MDDDRVKVWDVDSGELKSSLEKPEFVLCAWFSAMGKCFAACRAEQGVEVWDVAAGQLSHRLEGLKGFASKLFFGGDGLLLVDSRGDGIRLFDASTGKQLQTFSRSGIHTTVRSAAFSPDRKLVAAAIARRIHAWDRKTGILVHLLPEHHITLENVQFVRDSQHLVTLDTQQKVSIWPISEGGVLFGLPEATLRLKRCSVAFSKDGRWFVEGIPLPGKIKMWDVKTAEMLLTLRGHESNVERVAFAADGEKLFSKSPNRIIVWRAPRK